MMKDSIVAAIPANRERLFVPRKQQGFFCYPGSKMQLKTIHTDLIPFNLLICFALCSIYAVNNHKIQN